MNRQTSRRGFLAAVAVTMCGPALTRLAGQQGDSLAGRGTTGTLRDPEAAGQQRDRVTALDDNLFIQAVEHRLKCQCGCNLDVFTCRTTDFTCGTSPRMHRHVMALHAAGKDAQGIVDAFVAEYGEQVLMAPKPEGFNWAGYLLPGVLILGGGGVLATVLRRRIALRLSAASAAPTTPAAPAASPDDLDRLRRALGELES